LTRLTFSFLAPFLFFILRLRPDPRGPAGLHWLSR